MSTTDILADVDLVLRNEVVDRHSFFQLQHFVIGAEPTTQAKLQCCLRELKTRRQNLDAIGREADDVDDQTAALQAEHDRVAQEVPSDAQGFELPRGSEAGGRFRLEQAAELKGLRRRIDANTAHAGDLRRKAGYIAEECQFFVAAFRQLEATEPLRPWDDIAVQKEYWDAKFGREFRTRLLLGQPIDHELIRAIEQLHDDAPTKQAVAQLVRRQEDLNRRAGLLADPD